MVMMPQHRTCIDTDMSRFVGINIFDILFQVYETYRSHPIVTNDPTDAD